MTNKFSWLLASAYLLFIGLGWLQQSQPGSLSNTSLLSGSLWAVGIAAIGTFVLMGLPGALLLGLYHLLGLLPARIQGDRIWPAAVIISLVWPLGLPMGQLLAWVGAIIGQAELLRWGTAVGWAAWIFAIGLLIRRGE